MNVLYRGSTLELEGEPALIGYEIEPVSMRTLDDKEAQIGFLRGKTQLIVSLPFANEENKKDMRSIADGIPKEAMAAIRCVAVFGKRGAYIDGFETLVDVNEEFGDNYGVRIANGDLAGEFAKAAFIVSKDGSLYYKQLLPTLEDSFDLDRLFVQLTKAFATYNGKGCGE